MKNWILIARIITKIPPVNWRSINSVFVYQSFKSLGLNIKLHSNWKGAFWEYLVLFVCQCGDTGVCQKKKFNHRNLAVTVSVEWASTKCFRSKYGVKMRGTFNMYTYLRYVCYIFVFFKFFHLFLLQISSKIQYVIV